MAVFKQEVHVDYACKLPSCSESICDSSSFRPKSGAHLHDFIRSPSGAQGDLVCMRSVFDMSDDIRHSSRVSLNDSVKVSLNILPVLVCSLCSDKLLV